MAALDSEDFVEAVILRYEGKFEAALGEARSLYERASWQYEARKLEGDIHAAQGDQLRDGGSYEEAEMAYRHGERAYLAAVDVARSDVRPYESLCLLEDSRMQMVMLRSRDPLSSLESGIQWCGKALEVDPDRALAYRLLASLYTRQGQWPSQDRGQIEEALSKAAMHAGAAIERGFDDPDAHRSLGLALSQQARVDIQSGRDPRQAVEEASAAFETSLELRPDLDVSYTNLAEVLAVRYGWESAQGMDPRESLAAAARSYEEAMSENPELDSLTARIGPLHLARAQWELDHDFDPLASAGQAISSFEAALAQNPEWVLGHQGLGSAHALTAIWEHRQGSSAAASMKKAALALDRALELSPNLPDARLRREEISLLEARDLLAAGQNADPVVERGLAGVRSFLERRPEDAQGLKLLSDLEALAQSG